MTWFGGNLGLVIAGVAALVAGTGLAYVALTRLLTDKSTLARAVEPYDAGTSAAGDVAAGTDTRLADLRSAVDRLAAFGRGGTVLRWTETRLDQANLALRAPEAVLLYVVALVVGGAAALLAGGTLVGGICSAVLLLVPPYALHLRAQQRLRLFTQQLPDALVLTASSLKAGYSFLQGVEAVAQEVREPMASELRRVMVEARLGRPVEEALADCAERMKSPDFEWAVRAVAIQREVGGNLAELLETVADTMIERERLRRDIKSLTAEGRMSAIVLGILPGAVGLALYVVNPTYLRVLADNTGGRVALVGAVLGMIVGFIWMNKVIDVDV